MSALQMSMGRFEERLGARARRERQPLSCLFELTPRCNLRCKFCYVALDPYQGPYLDTEQACRILDIVERAGVLWLTLTGGEVFSRRDFATIYEYALAKGLLVTIYTNATMVTESIAQLLADRPPFSVEVSIYGADAGHYEATTGIPGSFARFERGIARLQAAGVPLLLATVQGGSGDRCTSRRRPAADAVSHCTSRRRRSSRRALRASPWRAASGRTAPGMQRAG